MTTRRNRENSCQEQVLGDDIRVVTNQYRPLLPLGLLTGWSPVSCLLWGGHYTQRGMR